MKIFRLKYQHYKDIVEDNILTVFVVAKSKSEVEAFAKHLHYAVEDIAKVSEKEYEHEKANNEHFRLEYVDHYL